MYFRDADDDSVGGALEQYRYTDPRLHYRPGRAVDRKSFVGMSAQDLSSVPEGDVEKVSSVPYGANVLVMWLNTPYALHGVSPRHPTAWTRKYVNFIGESFAGDGAGFFQMTHQPSR